MSRHNKRMQKRVKIGKYRLNDKAKNKQIRVGGDIYTAFSIRVSRTNTELSIVENNDADVLLRSRPRQN